MSGVRRRKRRREQPEAREQRRFCRRWGCYPWPWSFRSVDEVLEEWSQDVMAGLLLLQGGR
jgi:hypothetical protein